MPKRSSPDHPFAVLLRERMKAYDLTDVKVSAALATAGHVVGASAVRSWRVGVALPRDVMRGALAGVIGSTLTEVAVACAGAVYVPSTTREW